jgi:hypothetical protein
MTGRPDTEMAIRRKFRRVACPRCGDTRTEMRTFGTPRFDELGRPRPRRRIRRELRAMTRDWEPTPTCDRCTRLGTDPTR